MTARAGLGLLLSCVFAGSSVADGLAESFARPAKDYWPETWLQISGGNASEKGMTLDL